MPYVLRTRTKKFLGVFFILAVTLVYCMVTVTIAAAGLSTAPWYIHMLFFATTGVLWVLPAMGIIKWMVTDTGRG